MPMHIYAKGELVMRQSMSKALRIPVITYCVLFNPDYLKTQNYLQTRRLVVLF